MLKRVFLSALALAPMIAPAALAASDEACTREMLKPVEVAAQPLHIDIAPLFEPQFEGMEVLLARIGPDGKPVMACVDSAAAAKKFFEAPIEKVGRKEQ